MKQNHPFLKLALTCAVLLLGMSPAWGQNVTVKGQVIDASSGEPVIGAYVSLNGSNKNGSLTDLDGNFSFTVPASTKESATVSAVCVGFADANVTLGEVMKTAQVLMKVESELIDEIVVVGYGSQKKTSAVGSISQTSGTELMKAGNMNSVSEALQGKLNGVIAFNTTGQPGDNAATIYIRGKSSWQGSSPLVLVDGIERNMNDVDFNEIESVSVLKDASATAVYGVRGGNGVILLTTKRGTSEQPRVNFNINMGLKNATTHGEWADYVTAMKIYNEAMANEGNWGKLYPQSTFDAWENAYATGNYGPYNDMFPQVNWADEILKTAVSENYNVNVNGKTNFVKYFASIGYQHDGSIYDVEKCERFDPRAYYNRLNWRMNFDFNLTKTTLLSVNIAGKMGNKNSQVYGGVYGSLTLAPTNTFPIKYSDGYWGSSASDMSSNPVADMEHGGQVKRKTFQGWYDVKLTQEIIKGLKAHAQLSYNSASTNRSRIISGAVLDGKDTPGNLNAFPREYRTYDYANPIYNEDGTISYNYTDGWWGTKYYDLPDGYEYDNTQDVSRRLYYEVGLNYSGSFNDHNVTAMALFNRQKIDNGDGSTFNYPSFREDWVGRVTYNWKERYLMEANISYTGSEKFAPGKRFGLFPSASIGWRLTEEPWMKWSKKVLTNAKFRYSWGKVGTDAGAGRWQYVQLYNQQGAINFGKNENTAFGPTYSEGTIAQPNATWETSIKQNLGIELSFWKKLSVAIDLFDEKREGILLAPRTTATWTGVSYSAANLGKTKNHGIDLEVKWQDKIGSDFNYFLNFAFSTSENRVVFRDDPRNFLDYQKDAGKPIGWQSRYIASGNYETIDDIYNAAHSTLVGTTLVVPGDLAYIDYNADGEINNKDNVITQHLNYPLTTYSATIGFDWKGLSFSMMFYSPQGAYKNYVNCFLWDFPSKAGLLVQPQAMERWTVATANTEGIKRPTVHYDNNSQNSQASNYRYRDYSYVRLKNIELSYTLPKKWQKAMMMSNCQVYASGNNLFTWWKGDYRIDPETTNSDGGVNENADIYPIVRTFTFGLRFGF